MKIITLENTRQRLLIEEPYQVEISETGEVTKILNTTIPWFSCSDFEYIKEKNLLIVPTFFNNTIIAYKLN